MSQGRTPRGCNTNESAAAVIALSIGMVAAVLAISTAFIVHWIMQPSAAQIRAEGCQRAVYLQHQVELRKSMFADYAEQEAFWARQVRENCNR